MVLTKSDLERAKVAVFAAVSAVACAKIDDSHLNFTMEGLDIDSLDFAELELELEDEVGNALGGYTEFSFDYAPDKTLETLLSNVLTELQRAHGAAV